MCVVLHRNTRPYRNSTMQHQHDHTVCKGRQVQHVHCYTPTPNAIPSWTLRPQSRVRVRSETVVDKELIAHWHRSN